MTKEEVIWWVNHLFEIRKEEYFNKGMMEDAKEVEEAQCMAIEALQTEGVGRYEKAMQKLREMPRHLNGVKEKLIKKIPIESVEMVRCEECQHANECHKSVQYTRNGLNTIATGYLPIEWCSRGERSKQNGK